jgi:hypothetical protein
MVRYNPSDRLVDGWVCYIRLGRKSTGFGYHFPKHGKNLKEIGKIAISCINKLPNTFAMLDRR